ncbi:hypothetical protein H632_c227p3, partial [Helicosporidium sp. ATCC 50920]
PPPPLPAHRCEVDRVDGRTLSVADFVERYERPGIPAIVTHLCDGWPAQQSWTLEALAERFGAHRFKVGADDDGYAVRMTLADYAYYCSAPRHASRDDSPMTVFEGGFGRHRCTRALLGDYAVPALFSEDLFRHVGARRRPPWRWLVLGPERSGTGVHQDPLATSAWNALLRGRKRWALLPPETPRELVRPPGEPDREACTWFRRVWPMLDRMAREDEATIGLDSGRSSAGRLRPSRAPLTMLNFVQHPGDTVFVPGKWWHAVLNLDFTVAITHNFASSAGFDEVWRHAKKGRPKMALRWRRRLEERRPDLAERISDMERRGTDGLPPGMYSSSSSSSSDPSSASDSDGEESVTGSSSSSSSDGERKEACESKTEACESNKEARESNREARESNKETRESNKEAREPKKEAREPNKEARTKKRSKRDV